MLRLSFGFILWLAISLCVFAAPPCRAGDAVVIAVNEDILPDYLRFVHERNLLEIHDYTGEGARRDVIELVLLMQAVQLGGFKEPIELRAEQSYLRTLRDIADGRFITSAGLAWKSDIVQLQDAYFTSPPLIQEGKFVVGLYTTAKNQKSFEKLPNSKIKELKVVTSSQWKSDVQTLQNLGFQHIAFSPNWVNMGRMIEANRADLTLAPFQASPHMAIIVGDVTLLPIKGIKVAIAGSRHWPISRKHPQGKAFYKALVRGLAKLEAKGTIQRAYRECGFFHPDVAQWTLLNSVVKHP